MIADFDLLAADLDRQIRAEEDRTKNHDPAHFAYPTLAKATIRRRDNIIRSAAKLKIQLDAAKKAFSEAVEELGAVALLDEGDRIRDQSQVIGGEQGEQVSDLNHAS
jgi:flagellar protein FliJ